MKIPLALSPRLYCGLAAFVAVMFAGTVGGCFALALQGKAVPEFATKQLLALGGILTALLTGPHSQETQNGTSDNSTSDNGTSAPSPSDNPSSSDASSPAQ